MTGDPAPPAPIELDRPIGRLITIGTYASVAVLAVGVGLMFAMGITPRAGGPPFDLSRVIPDLVNLRPEGFLWLGLVSIVASPAARVLASLVAYARRGERAMALVAILILAVIVLSVALARGLEG